MNLSRIFIQRPVATVVIMLALFIFGWFAYPLLPISELPNVDFPTIVVSASVPGADPQTMATTVALPLEKQLSTISGIDSMTSVSSNGSTQITIQFNLSRNIDAAAQDVQSAISQAIGHLPSALTMPNPPTIKKVNPADSPVLFLALTGDNITLSDLDNYAENVIAPQLSMKPGVAQVNVFGAQQYAVRIYLNPYAMASRGLDLSQVAQTIDAQNPNLPAGTLQTEGAYRLITIDGGLNNADQFSHVILSTNNGATVFLKDIATVSNSVSNDKVATWLNHQRAVVLAIDREPGANTVSTVQNLLKLMPTFTKELPGGAKLSVVYDRSVFIQSSIHEVQWTLIFAAILVALVVFLFLNTLTSTIIAVLSLPVSIVGTFGAMYLCNFSLDNLSLMALILAVGFVIDDAVVVLENIMRHMEQGLDSMKASLVGSREITFTVVSMTLSLVAVFIPIFFMGGLIGRLFNEFAAVVGISILLSGLVSLTLIPMLCSRFLKTNHTQTTNAFLRYFDRAREVYIRSLRSAVTHYRSMLLIALLLLIAMGALFYIVPKGFIPSEDTGMIMATVQAPEGETFEPFVQSQQAAENIILKNPNVDAVMSSVGQGSGGSTNTSTGRFIIRLKPLNERSATADKIIQQLRGQLQNLAGLQIVMANPPALRIGGKVSSGNYQYTLQSTQWSDLQKAAASLEKQMATIPGVQDVDSDLKLNNPQLELHILRDKAAVLGITPAQIETTLYSAYGQRQISSIMQSSGEYEVIMEVDPQYQKSRQDLNALYLQSSSGQMIPLSTLVTVRDGAGPLNINHVGQLPAITLSFNLAPGVALGSVTQAIQTMADKTLPSDVTGGFAGTAQTFQKSMESLPLLLLITILVIYMVLAILYEHFIHPLTILTAIPFALLGALLAIILFHQELDLFSFIGLIMLVGLTKKNGIMMVDFALSAEREHQMNATEAIIQACAVRFRPIMMTTFAAILAGVPLALGLGAGGETRRIMGVTIVGGLIFSQLVTLYITPVFYVTMARITQSLKSKMK